MDKKVPNVFVFEHLTKIVDVLATSNKKTKAF